MSTTDLLSGPLAQAIGLALLHALWQGAIVAGALAAVLALMSRRSAALRYAVACGALTLIFVLAVATAWRSYTPKRETIVAPQAMMAVPADDAVLIAASDTPRTWIHRWLAAVAATRAHIPQIVFAWLAGVLILTLRLAWSWSRALSLAHRDAVAADPFWQRVAMRLSDALGMRTAVRLVVSSAVEVPSVVGWLKPVILLPISSFSGLTTEQLEMVLAHELAHIRRHDFLVNALQSVVETLLFYHPAVWWLSHQIRVERENCADDLAISVSGDAIQYARALAQLEELRAPAPALAANGGSLIERVRRLVGSRSDRSLFATGWTAAAAMASFVLLLALTTAPMLAERRAQPAPPQPPHASVDVKAPQTPPPPPAVEDQEQTDETPEPDIEPPDVEPELVPVAMPTIAITPMPAIAPIAMAAPAITPMPDDEDETPSSTPPGKLSIDDLIALRVSGVTPEYVNEIRAVFGDSIRIRDISAMRMQGVSADYVRQMRNLFGEKLSSREIVNLRVQGISPDEVAKYRGMFSEPLGAREVVSLKVMGVTSDYLREMRAAGVELKTSRDATSLRALNVTPAFVKALADAGYPNLSVRDLRRLASNGINADFVREMQKYHTNK
ncbi:MAG TPA: M56 family metallopeptidase [Thermoanaerobaculia bacterium]|jgi:beta-lactamase regulating signal transducer with metallopeptidase domain|nr:M56 family metallopeptidase [Thermoanaerobaculia bacterium]